jgi:hypothetical protein
LISINSIKIIDSLNFIPSSLAKFPKTFNLTELKKGYFPHKFNNLDNQNYIGLLPSKEFYGYEYMSDKDSKEFLIWHDINKDKNFNFKEELISYCESDVNILKLGCLSFRESYLELIKNFEHNIDPFRDCCTLASLCQLTYRALFMKSESIALINDQGFNPHNTFSAKQILWLRFLAKNNNTTIIHCLNATSEFKIGKYKVDGYHEESNTVYEFQGCWFHGCSKCFDPKTINPFKKQTMQTLFEKTKRKEDFIRSKNYNFIPFN